MPTDNPNDNFLDQGCNLCGHSFAAHGNDPDAACPVTATVPEVAPADDSDGSVDSIIAEAANHNVTVLRHRPTANGYFELIVLGPIAGLLSFFEVIGWGSQFTTWTQQADGRLTCPENEE